MATQYSTLLKLALPTQGELSGSWGDVVNNNITSMIEEAVAGSKTINTWSGNSATLSTADGTTAEARAAILNLTDTGTSLSGAATVICPALTKTFIVKNGTAQTVTVKTASGTGIAITAGSTGHVYCDGTNVVESQNYVAGNFGVGGNLTVTGTTTFNGGTVTLGDANTDNIVFGGEIDSNIIPDDDGAYDLGSASKEWKDIYIDGSAYIDGLAEDMLVATDKKILFRDSALFINSSADGQLDIAADTEVEVTTALLEISADATVGDDLTLKSDAAVLGFGADTDVTLTHVADTALLLNSSRQLQFGDSGTYIHQSADGVLDLVSDTEIEINATTIDINGAAELSGNLTLGAQLRMPDNTASKLLIADGTSYEEKAVGDLSEISTVANDDVFLAVDTSGGGLKKITRSTIVSGLAASGAAISNVVDDTTPQLGGNLDMNGADIVTTSNADIELAPNGTGHVTVKGNTNQGTIQLNCENNSHGQQIKAAPHSESASNVLTLPSTGGDARLVSTTSTATLTNKTLTDPVITNITGSTITLDSAGDITLNADGADVLLKDAGTTYGGLSNNSGELLIKSGTTTAMTFSGANVTLEGNLTVSGTTTTVNSTTVDLNDHNIVLDSGNSTSAVVNGAGITIEGGSGDDATFTYNTTGPKFELKLGSSHEDLQVDQLIAASLDISGNVDVDGTLEADAMTLNGTAITTTATLSTGISNGNIAVFTSGVADDDFLRVNGTSIEGRSASELASDIGAATTDDATALAIALGQERIMANTFKVVNFAAEPASSGTPYVMYTAASSTTTVVLGLILSNIHTSQVTATVRLVSDTANRAVTNNTANGTSIIVKDAPIPVGSSLELMAGNKVVLETTDQITVDCSVADKLSGTLSIMEIT